MGTYNYVVYGVQSEISLPCKPVSLSYNIYFSADYLL